MNNDIPNIIKLLPDSVANQIAAGEVVQRPASAVKELLENSVDAGASEINLLIKDAGRTSIQVVDNGCGMNEIDARLCFDRHATSKITKTEDLFAIRTLGFRGEAMASIAAIAQVEMKTKRHQDELGVELNIEASKVIKQSACQCLSGTNIIVKNLFFNIPARRNFLKSDKIEMKHIIDELIHIAMANVDLSFNFYENGKLKLKLEKSNLKQRLVQIFGNNYNKRLVKVEEATDRLNINGFIGKPEFAKKTRGEQFFFVNGRYIRHPYFHHAIKNAFDEMIHKTYHPSYFIFFNMDPKLVDVNIHPTKTEVKFSDEKI